MRQKPEGETVDYSAALIRRQAMDLLARREHSCYELRQKLQRKGHDAAQITEVLAQMSGEGLQSDRRFTECFISSRINRGEGPVRVRAALAQRGISDELIAESLDGVTVDWQERAETARQKRFGDDWPQNYKERARQARFLQQRGFSMEQINRLLFRD